MWKIMIEADARWGIAATRPAPTKGNRGARERTNKTQSMSILNRIIKTENGDILKLVFDHMDFSQLRKMPFLCKATRDALDWSSKDGYLESRAVRFPTVDSDEPKIYVVKGNGWLNNVTTATIKKTTPRAKTLLVGVNKRLIKRYHAGRHLVECVMYDSSAATGSRSKSRTFTPRDFYIHERDKDWIEANNQYWGWTS